MINNYFIIFFKIKIEEYQKYIANSLIYETFFLHNINIKKYY